MKRFAVIDLGTNTFHLIIAARKGVDDFVVVYRERAFVKLAEEGINTIGIHAFKRGLEALEKFRSVMDLFEVIDYRAVATAAMRNAENAGIFRKRALRSFGIDIEVISGSREATLIYKGIRHAKILSEETSLIMDIGGGSVEFIIGNKDKILWSDSYDIGAAVLKDLFHDREPISAMEILELRNFLDKKTKGLQEVLDIFKPTDLVGASGTFDVLADNLTNMHRYVDYPVVTTEAIRAFTATITKLNHGDRLKHPGIPESRADLIVVALQLIAFVLDIFNPEYIKISSSALKEGILTEMILSTEY